MPKIDFDLVICSYGRPDLLRATSIRSRGRVSCFNEVIVVDNNPEPILRRLCQEFGYRHIHEPIAGLSQARNAVLHSSLAKYVWFIDDDASLCNTFSPALEKQIENLRTLEKHRLPIYGGGLILPYFPDTSRNRPRISKFELGLLSCIPDRSSFQIPWGCNMFVDRQAAVAVGGFKTSLARTGTGLLSGEEDDLFLRLRAEYKDATAECLNVYFEGCSVDHWIPRYRMGIKWQLKRSFYGGVSNYIVYQSYGARELSRDLAGFVSRPSKEKLLQAVFAIGKRWAKSKIKNEQISALPS